MNHAVIQEHIAEALACLRAIKAAGNGKVRKAATKEVRAIEELAHAVFIHEKNAARSFPSPVFP